LVIGARRLTNPVLARKGNNMDQRKFDQYVEIQKQINLLEDQKKQIGVDLMAQLEEQNLKTLKHPAGSFTIMERRRYEYSSNVIEMTEKLRQTKFKEEMDGTAQKTITKSLQLRLKK